MTDTATSAGTPVQALNGSHHAVVLQPTRPIYDGAARVISWNESSSMGMWTKLVLLDVEADEIHPFRGFRASKSNGQLLHVEITAPWLDNAGLYNDESMLLWWDESPAGMGVKIAFQDGPDGAPQHPLKGLSGGHDNGDEVQVRIWAYDDQYRVVAKRRRLNTLKHVVVTCKRDPEFRRWLRANITHLGVDPDCLPGPVSARDPGEDYAAEAVRLALGIGSRSVLNRSTEDGRRARQAWLNLFRSYEDSVAEAA